jgi:hypothetical protein
MFTGAKHWSTKISTIGTFPEHWIQEDTIKQKIITPHTLLSFGFPLGASV